MALKGGVFAVVGGVVATVGYFAYATCGGLGLFLFGLAIIDFGGAGAEFAGARVLSVAVPFGLVLMFGGLYLATLPGCV